MVAPTPKVTGESRSSTEGKVLVRGRQGRNQSVNSRSNKNQGGECPALTKPGKRNLVLVRGENPQQK